MSESKTIRVDLNYLQNADLHRYLSSPTGFFFDILCEEKDIIDLSFLLEREGIKSATATDGFMSWTTPNGEGYLIRSKYEGKRRVQVKFNNNLRFSNVFPELA